MREQPDFTGEFENCLEQAQPAANLDRIERRTCASDKYDGAEYTFYGWYVPVRPILDRVARMDGFNIESLSYINESSDENDLEPHLNVFLADTRDERSDTHPAFTEGR